MAGNRVTRCYVFTALVFVSERLIFKSLLWKIFFSLVSWSLTKLMHSFLNCFCHVWLYRCVWSWKWVERDVSEWTELSVPEWNRWQKGLRLSMSILLEGKFLCQFGIRGCILLQMLLSSVWWPVLCLHWHGTFSCAKFLPVKWSIALKIFSSLPFFTEVNFWSPCTLNLSFAMVIDSAVPARTFRKWKYCGSHL